MNSTVKLIDYSPKRELDLARYARISRGATFDSIRTDEEDEKTLINVYNAGHLSVLEFASLAFEVTCPIFVARQLLRYRTGSYIERSLRYCEPLAIETPTDEFDEAYNSQLALYWDDINRGVAKEVARKRLTLNAPTRFICKYNLRNLFHIFDERLARCAQSETRDVVEEMRYLTANAFPKLVFARSQKQTAQRYKELIAKSNN